MMRITLVVAALTAALIASDSARAQGRVYPYRAIDLGVVPGQSAIAGVGSEAISPSGEWACGWSVWEPFVWRRGVGMIALPKPAGQVNALVLDVNDSGQAVGSAGLTGGVATYWDSLGNVTALGMLPGGRSSRAVAVNNAGLVLGSGSILVGSTLGSHLFTWTPTGGMVDITPNATRASAYDLNDRGQMGVVIDGTPYRLDPGQPPLNLGTVIPHNINRFGQMTGLDYLSGVAGRYTDGIGWEMFANGSQIQFSGVGAPNGLGQVPGTQAILQHNSPPSYLRYGYLYTFGLGFQKLDDLVDPAQQVRVKYAHGITDEGHIIVEGSIGPDNRAMILEPRFVQSYGSGCPGGNGEVPVLGAAGMPAAGGRLALLGAGGAPSGTAILAIGINSANQPLPGGCAALVDLAGPLLTAPIALNPIGQGGQVFSVPPNMPRIRLYAQMISLDANAPNGSYAMSNGVQIDVQ